MENIESKESMENSENKMQTAPRIALPDFEGWLGRQGAMQLLTPLAYLYCVDGCGPDEVSQRFALVEAAAQRAGKSPEEIARWHTMHEELYARDRGLFAEAAYHWERRMLTSLTPFQLISEVSPKEAEYLIEPYLPLGMLTVLGGVSGVGKTWLALYWAAQISRSFATEERGAVYYFTQENDPAVVLRPRLEALDAETERVIIQRIGDTSQALTLDDERLEAAANALPPRLVIFDPIQSYLGARVEMNKANQVRPILDWLGRFAQRHQCAVVLVSHMAKPSQNNGDALDRLLGSSDFRNAARSIVIVGRDPDDPEVRVFAHAKNSLGQPGPSRRYRVGDDGVLMLGECEWTANDIIKVAGRSTAGRPATSLAAATEALQELIGEKGWTSVEDVKKLCTDKGLSMASMYRARTEMNLKMMRNGHKAWWISSRADNTYQQERMQA